jgi:hypothetical protein
MGYVKFGYRLITTVVVGVMFFKTIEQLNRIETAVNTATNNLNEEK